MRDHTVDLCERGAAFPSVFETIETLRENIGLPSCIVAFQLPFRLHLKFEDVEGIGNQSYAKIHFKFINALTYFDNRQRRKTIPIDGEEEGITQSIQTYECTQCLALMPLWGTRLNYYETYSDLSEMGKETDIVIPRENKPSSYSLSGSITVQMFEQELAKRTIAATASAIRRFLRDYMALSLHEVPMPSLLYSPFASPRQDRYFPLGDSPDLLHGLVNPNQSRALKDVSHADILRAAKWPARSFSTFEIQMLALKRLSDQGEPELGLLGLMALIEWYMKQSLVKHQQVPEKGTWSLHKQVGTFYEVPDAVMNAIHKARGDRNSIAHDQPTSKKQSYDPLSTLSKDAASATDANNVMHLFDNVAIAAFELFRCINGYSSTENP